MTIILIVTNKNTRRAEAPPDFLGGKKNMKQTNEQRLNFKNRDIFNISDTGVECLKMPNGSRLAVSGYGKDLDLSLDIEKNEDGKLSIITSRIEPNGQIAMHGYSSGVNATSEHHETLYEELKSIHDGAMVYSC